MAEQEVLEMETKEGNTEVRKAKKPATAKKARKTPKKKKKWVKWLIIGLVIAAIPLTFLGIWIYENSQLYKVCRVEAGVAVDVKDFLVNPEKEASFTEESDKIDITVPGEYNLIVKLGLYEHKCTLYIEDTIAPVVEVQPVRLEYGQTCTVDDFVVKVEDATATKVAFAKEPDFTLKEKQTIKVAVTDAGNNTTTAETELVVSLVVKTLDVEAGSEKPEITDFVIVGAEDAEILTDLDEIDYVKPATHSVKIELDGNQYDVAMNIVDTVAPVFEVKNISGYALIKREAADFVTSSEDVTEITFSFETAPDLNKTGSQTLTIVATDEGGNQAKQQATLTLEKDTEKPVISGAADFTAYVGTSVSYKSKVKVTDNCPEELELKVDSSKVNLNQIGTYPVTYTATDKAGNSTSVTVNVTVKEQTYDINEVNALADAVLARITNAGMSQKEKALAIFNYCKGNIGYINDSVKGNYVRSAYEGLVNKRGDCYVYASTAKVLLTRAGIKNMDIERIPSRTTMHFWNLVDIGDGHGWYHFDTTPRWNHPVMFLWTDAQIKQYSDANNNSHNYDRSKYPEIK